MAVSNALGSLNTLGINPTGGGSGGGLSNNRSIGSSDFRDALKNFRDAEKTAQPGSLPTLKFSNHAVERMQLRGIHFNPQQMQRIGEAVQKAAAKGAKSTLLLTDNSALIVSIKDNTVVTVLDRQAMKDNVFTNIDSTVMV